MNVQRIDNTPFQSRNQTIRFADDIARRVNQCYPRISLTKIKSFENAKQYPSLIDNIAERLSKNVRDKKGDMYDDADSFCKKIKAFIAPVKKNGLGNCGESAHLASIVAKINGIKDCQIRITYGNNHGVLVVLSAGLHDLRLSGLASLDNIFILDDRTGNSIVIY